MASSASPPSSGRWPATPCAARSRSVLAGLLPRLRLYPGTPLIWRGVRKLPPAHTLIWEDEKLSLDRYWRARLLATDSTVPSGAGRGASIADRRGGTTANDRHVPLGAFLSGGVDSSIVVSEIGLTLPQPVKTFSIGFAHEQYNELPKARVIADRFATDLTSSPSSPTRSSCCRSWSATTESPSPSSFGDPQLLPCRGDSAQVTVALNGDGGDESFAGYLRYPANAVTAWVDHVPAAIRTPNRRTLAPLARLTRKAQCPGLRSSLSDYPGRAGGARRYAAHVGRTLPERAGGGSGPFLRADSILGERRCDRRAMGIATGSSALDVLLQTDVETCLPPGDLLPRFSTATMAHSLEARSPSLLDPEVMEFAAALPDRYKGPARAEEVDSAPRLPTGCPGRSLADQSGGSAFRSDLVSRGATRLGQGCAA